MSPSDSRRSCYFHNEQCGTNTIKENICSETIQTTAKARHRENVLKRKHEYY